MHSLEILKIHNDRHDGGRRKWGKGRRKWGRATLLAQNKKKNWNKSFPYSEILEPLYLIVLNFRRCEWGLYYHELQFWWLIYFVSLIWNLIIIPLSALVLFTFFKRLTFFCISNLQTLKMHKLKWVIYN